MHISIWERETFFARRDVIIIGGGLAGLWCAYELLQKNPSLRLSLIDKGIVPAGASTRNAGFACFGSPTELIHDADSMGEKRMLQLAEMRYKGIRKIRSLFGDKAIGYDDCGGYECLRNDINNTEQVMEDLCWLNKEIKVITGDEQTFTKATQKQAEQGLQGFDTLIENKHEGGLHSGKLVMALGEKVRNLGGQILQGIEASHWEEAGDSITIFTKQNISLQASQIILCTNALSPHFLPEIFLTPARGQVLVTTPVPDLPLRGTFHFDEGFYYFRNVGNRILLGGARNAAFNEEATTSFDTSPLLQDKLEAFLRQHILPEQSFKIEYRWSGIMGFTENKQPLLQRISNRITAVVVCNGMGVALSPVIAEQIEL